MLCPFCLAAVTFSQERPRNSPVPVQRCPQCKEQVPALYANDYQKFPPVVTSAIGFRQHGKTIYFASLFYALKKLQLATHWRNFFTMGLNEDSLDTVQSNVALLEGGNLPYSTPKNFPRPTMLRVQGIPSQRDCTLVCYDTGGECFERSSQLVQYAGFVRRAKTAMLLVSLADLDDPGKDMHRLLNTYLIGMGELAATTREQHLIVVYTKADELAQRLQRWRDIETYLTQQSFQGLANPQRYLEGMRTISARLEDFTRREAHADEFVNAATRNFASVSYSIISALGVKPIDGQLPMEIVPRRVLDPLLWMMERSLPRWQTAWQRWFRRG